MVTENENEVRPKVDPSHADKFTWGEGDVTVYESEADWEAAMLLEEIERTDAILREAGVDPDNPEATLGNLDEEDDE